MNEKETVFFKLNDFIKSLTAENEFIGYQLLIEYGSDANEDEDDKEYYLSQIDEAITKSAKEIKSSLYPFFKKLDSIKLDKNEFAYISLLLLDNQKNFVDGDYYFQCDEVDDKIIEFLGGQKNE